MLDPDVVVVVFAAVGGSEVEVLLADSHARDLLGASVGRIALDLRHAEGAEQCQIELEGAFDVVDREVNVVDGTNRHLRASSRCRRH